MSLASTSVPAAPMPKDEPARPFSPQLVLGLTLSAIILFIDGYDLAALPLALPHIVRELQIPAANFGFALSAVLVGLGAGAVLLAPIGDRFGRRPTIIVTVALIGLTTIGTASANSVAGFSTWRLLTGLMLGACLPNVTAQVALWAPEGKRASTITIVSLGISIGGITSGLVVPLLVSFGGWRAIFLLPGIATVLLAIVLFFLTPRKGSLPERQDETSVTKPARRGGQLLDILRPPLLVATVTFALIYGLNAFAIYLTSSWIPTLLPKVGFSLGLSARFMSIVNLGGLVAGLVIAKLVDRSRVTRVLSAAYATIGLAFVSLTFVPPNPWTWGALLFLSAGGTAGVHLALVGIATDFFPARYMATAIGFGVAVARIGAIGGPMVGGWLIASGISVTGFFLYAALAPAACLAATWLVPAAQRARH
ncbi:MFS transporter [Rhizorhapis suberifaciens]|uniref:AAHS family 4-hydroxybenzoate transporter-like MFS transporter n=1 Tax=Rhizorhapis suberifaciens TaxID=13656 RepID=A0A840HTA2_9SPHN|nr:MFS transporter [Rhizorhapis suberifaciens]MBB4641153.1 AAHS family 4-hydroxybenzoate transporter-like MFS transporter [Rhizorhapis suberifaciens]